jgi:hypothetical protein
MTKLECAIIKAENKIAYRCVGRCMDYVVESDFNPDLIISMGEECYATGMHTGMIATAVAASCIGLTVAIIHRIKKHRK